MAPISRTPLASVQADDDAGRDSSPAGSTKPGPRSRPALPGTSPSQPRIGPARAPVPNLRALALTFCPAWLKTPGKAERYRVFLRSYENLRGVTAFLIEGPDELPSGPMPVTMDVRDLHDCDWWFSGTLSRIEGNLARVTLRNGPTRRPARTTRIRPRGHLAAVALSLDDPALGRLCFPVIDINAHALRMDASLPLEPGMNLHDMAIAVDRIDVRWCHGVVTDSTEVIETTGRRRYHCGVRLRAGETVNEWSSAGGSVVVVRQPKRVRELLWAMCDFGRPVVLFHGKRQVHGRLTSAIGARRELPRMRCQVSDASAAPSNTTLRVTCVMFGSAFEFFARTSTDAAGDLVLSPAPVLREKHRRAGGRTALPSELEARICYRNPIDGAAQMGPVLEMGLSGLGFAERDAANRFWPGLPLTEVQVRIGSQAFALRDVEVRSVDRERVGVRFAALAGEDSDRLRTILVELAGAPAHLHDGRDFDSVLGLHQSTGLLEPDMEAWLATHKREISANWERAHRLDDGLMRTVVVPWKDKIGASLTSVRAYERTWCLQHSSVLSPAVPTGAGILHSTLMALASARGDGEYIAGFVDAAARSLHGMVDSFMKNSIGEHRGAHEFVLYSAAAEPFDAGEVPAVRRLRKRDERLVHNVARRYLDPVCACALSLNEGEVELPATRAAYRRLGLDRGREAWGAFAHGRCAGVLLQEFASPGLSLSGLMNAALYLPLQAADRAERALQEDLCRLARRLRLPGLAQVRFLFVPRGVPETTIINAGFQPIGSCSLFAFHRLSLEAYNRHVANRYGLLRGRLEKRTSRNP